jgi:cytochrome oxidase assembly protein ShyY1
MRLPSTLVYRFLLSRRWLGLLAGALLVAAACLALGDWQLHRLAHRHERNDLIRDNLAQPAVRPERLLRVGAEPPAGDEWRRVRAVGRYDVAHQLLVRLRPFEGAVGFYVLTPLVTDAGPAILVNRGWVPGGQGAASVPRVAAPPSTDVTVTGRLRPSEDPHTGAAPPRGQVTRIDVPGLAENLPYPVYGGFLELTAQSPPTSRALAAPQLLPAPEPSEGPHLAYAVQWALFACLAVGGYVVLARREAADLRAAAEESAPAAPVRSVPAPRG